LEHHSANQFLKAANKPQFCPADNCFKLLVKMISASPIAGLSVIQILDNADAAFRILCAYVDRSIRDHHVRRQAATASKNELARSDFVF